MIFPGTFWKVHKHQRLHESHPWLQTDAHAGQAHVEQPQLSHLAAQSQVPEAQPQVEEQEQAMLGLVEKSSLTAEDAHGEVPACSWRRSGRAKMKIMTVQTVA